MHSPRSHHHSPFLSIAVMDTTTQVVIAKEAAEDGPDAVVPDIHILTSTGRKIPVHSAVLAAVSPVLASLIATPPRKHSGGSRRVIRMLGVPCDAVAAFVRFLHSSSVTEEELERYGMHLLALSHVYQVPGLKGRCTREVGRRLTAENAVDVLQLARLCDAPDLRLRSLRLIYSQFKAVERTEAWKFLQTYDPWLELEILQFIDEAETRKKRTRRHRREQCLYMQLSEAMDCLEHICTEGCALVGPNCEEAAKIKTPCPMFATCQGVQLLIRHFATCSKRVKGRCWRCKSMWQLLRLHSSICDQPGSCRVPLCRQFRVKEQQRQKKAGEEEDTRWRLLVRRVVSARAISSLSQPKRMKDHEARNLRCDQDVVNQFIL